MQREQDKQNWLHFKWSVSRYDWISNRQLTDRNWNIVELSHSQHFGELLSCLGRQRHCNYTHSQLSKRPAWKMFSTKSIDIQCLWNLSILECWIRTDWNERMDECRNDNAENWKWRKSILATFVVVIQTVRFWILHGSGIASFGFFSFANGITFNYNDRW